MKVRQEVYDTYWKFAARRQEVFFCRLRNEPTPWGNDPILQEFKFCNTYRASDRVSQYLIQHVIYEGDQNEEEVIFRILLFKIFNKIETWEYLERRLGAVNLSTFNFDIYSGILQEALDSPMAIYTSAYMSCANKVFGYSKKHQNHLSLIEQMVVKDKVSSQIVRARSLGDIYKLLLSYPLLGKFMAYQLAIDLNYSEVINFDENDFTVAGPGAERGIRKCFIDVGDKTDEQIIRWMASRQQAEFDRLELNFQSLWDRPLHLIDCQGLFCETDKYSRVAFPDLKSNRKRIKAKFAPNQDAIEYFYPPRWGINDRVRADIQAAPPRQDATCLQLSLAGV